MTEETFEETENIPDDEEAILAEQTEGHASINLVDDDARREHEENKSRRVRPKAQGQKGMETAVKDYDDWLRGFQWDWPDMKCKLERKSPGFVNGVQCSGYLEERNTPYPLAEIHQRWGGGLYEVRISGPRKWPQDQRIASLGRKHIVISGKPILDGNALPQDVQMSRNTGSGDPVLNSGPAQKGFMDIIGTLTTQAIDMAKGGGNGNNTSMQNIYKQSQDTVEKTAEARIAAIKDSADKEATMLRREADSAMKEVSQLKTDINQLTNTFQERIATASHGSTELLAALLPSMNQNTQQQVENVIRSYESREQRISQQAQADSANLQRFFEMREQNMNTMHNAQIETLKSSFNNQITLLQGQLQIVVAKQDLVERENKNLRDQLMTQQKLRLP